MVGCAGLAAVLAGPASAAPTPNRSCSVRDVTTSATYRYSATGTSPLATAISAAGANDTLRIRGTCVGDFVIGASLTLDGVNFPTLNGDGAGTTLEIDAGTVTVQNLTITGGNAFNGGGVLETGGALTLANSIVKHNAATNAGGGIYTSGGALTLTGTSVRHNSAGRSGGGIASSASSTTTLVNDSIARNTSDNVGGGIASSGALSLTDTSVSRNTATGLGGGGIWNGDGGALTVNNDTVDRNVAAQGGNGGGISNQFGSTATIADTSVNGNSATGVGGGIYNDGPGGGYGPSTVSLTNFSLNRNTALQGGAIYSLVPVTIETRLVGASTNDNLFGEVAGNAEAGTAPLFHIFITPPASSGGF
jgi:hypothetical protein